MVSEQDRGTRTLASGNLQRVPVWLFAALFVILVLSTLGRTVADPDLWGHIRFGQDTVASGRLTKVDSYSFTSDQPWVNHEWLAEIVIASAYKGLGNWGLLLLGAAVAVVSLLVLSSAVRASGAGHAVHLALLTAAFVGMYSQLTLFRPQLFSIPLFALELWVFARAERDTLRWLIVLPLIFAVWANLHGGWIVGMGILGLWAVIVAVRHRVPVTWAMPVASLAVVATLLNPYGVGLWRFLWQTVGLGRVEIEDWQPLWHIPSHLVVWAVTSAILFLAWHRRRRENLDRLIFLPTIFLGLLAMKVVRIDPYFSMASVVMLAPSFRGLGPRQLLLSRQPTTGNLAAVVTLFLVGLVAAGATAVRNGNCLPLVTRAMPEPEAVQFLDANRLHGRLLTWFDYGEYAIWHLAPELRVSYDGRRETVYSEAVQDAHLRFYFARDDSSYARAIKADYVWLPQWLPVIASLERDGWVPIFRGSNSVIFARQAGQYAQPPSVTGPRCFPGP